MNLRFNLFVVYVLTQLACVGCSTQSGVNSTVTYAVLAAPNYLEIPTQPLPPTNLGEIQGKYQELVDGFALATAAYLDLKLDDTTSLRTTSLSTESASMFVFNSIQNRYEYNGLYEYGGAQVTACIWEAFKLVDGTYTSDSNPYIVEVLGGMEMVQSNFGFYGLFTISMSNGVAQSYSATSNYVGNDGYCYSLVVKPINTYFQVSYLAYDGLVSGNITADSYANWLNMLSVDLYVNAGQIDSAGISNPRLGVFEIKNQISSTFSGRYGKFTSTENVGYLTSISANFETLD